MFGESFDYTDEVSDVKDEVITSLAESIETTLGAVESFLSGDTKHFKDASIVNQ